MPAELVAPDRGSLLRTVGGELHLWHWGDPSAPQVLLLHGASDHARLWEGGIPTLLSLGFGVAAMDLRGHGDTRATGTSTGVWLELDALLAARHLGPPVGIIGHSMGGRVALGAAAAMPEYFRWLITLEGLGAPASISAPEPAVAWMLERIERLATQNTEPRRYAGLAEMEESRARINPRIPAVWMKHLVEHGHRAVPDGGVTWKGDPVRVLSVEVETLQEIFGAVECPVLVVTGDEPDTWSCASEPELFNRVAWMPRARRVSIPRAGHYPHLEQPDAVWARVHAFLRDQQ